MLNKHKLFLLCAKWIPVVTAIGILVTNTKAIALDKDDINEFKEMLSKIQQ